MLRAPLITKPSHIDYLVEIKKYLFAEINDFRCQYNLKPLERDTALDSTSRQWSESFKDNELLRHSLIKNVGENIACVQGSGNIDNAEEEAKELFDTWLNELKYLVLNGTWPDCSLTGSWISVGHISQILWKNTSHIGIGVTFQAKSKRLICVTQFYPPGNIEGEKIL